jgi:hypothetical protein
MRALLLAAALLLTTAASADAFIPHQGHYAGRDTSGRSVDFVFVDHHVKSWKLDNRIGVPDAYVSTSTNSFRRVFYHHDLEGGWTDANHVKGTYSYYRDTRRGLVKVTIHWTAHRKIG